MKRHLQCAEQAKWTSNLTNYCACHAEWMSSAICVGYGTSFPMRGASKVTLQPHRILRLPHNLEVEDLRWKCLQCFRQYKDDSRIIEDNPTIIEDKIVISHPPLRRPSPCNLRATFVLKNTTFRAPATSHNVTKCCACHRKTKSSVICVAYETSFPLRGASTITLEPPQILRLPHKMNVISDLRRIWNVISDARSK